ncbi:hypothetical protein ERJ75_000698400 [Trypanosoma vivax]|nr:hypothetical protein ERJ75_000698400 [Trypanosoma vivax]
MRPFSQHAARPVDPCAASVPSPTAACDAPPHGDPSHVRDSSLHRPRRKRRAPARPRTALLVLLRVRRQRCGAQASCPSALACLRGDARRAACVALLRRAAPKDCSGRADAARRAVRRFDKGRAAGCPYRTASCGAARTDRNPRPQRWAAGSGGKGQSNAGPIARQHDAAPTPQRAIFTGLGGRGDGHRQHLASEAARAQLARQGMARRDENAGARVRSRTQRICPLTLSGRPTLGRRR